MININQNTVSAENQMINSSEISFLGDPNAPVKILILGNSITRHGPNEEIGWHGDWGMAASAPEKDYVHLLYQKLGQAGKNVYMRIRQSAYWERHFREDDVFSYFTEERDFSADFVIFRLGENVPKDAKEQFGEHLVKLIDYLCPTQGRVLFTTCLWENPIVDQAIVAFAKTRKEPCIDLRYTDESMMALGKFEHKGVSMHPSDSGMEMIAEKIFCGLSKNYLIGK